MSETYAHLFRIPLTGLRFFTVYGPWGRPDMALWKFAERILSGRPIEVYNQGEMYRDFTYIDDIVGGVLACIDRPPADDGQEKAVGASSPIRCTISATTAANISCGLSRCSKRHAASARNCSCCPCSRVTSRRLMPTLQHLRAILDIRPVLRSRWVCRASLTGIGAMSARFDSIEPACKGAVSCKVVFT